MMMLFRFVSYYCTLVLCVYLAAISADCGSGKDSQVLHNNTSATEKTVEALSPFTSFYLVTRTNPSLCLTQEGSRVIMRGMRRPTWNSQLWTLSRRGNLYELINTASQLGLKSVDGRVVVDSSGRGEIWRVFATVGRFAQILHDPSVHVLTWNQTTQEVTTQVWVADSSQYWKLVSPLPLVQSELFGVSHGERFDDGAHNDIIQITLTYTDTGFPRIFLIQATYVSNGIEIAGPAHGHSPPGALSATFSLRPNREFIYKISGAIGPFGPVEESGVAAITFHVVDTRDGSTSARGPYGLPGVPPRLYQTFETGVGKVVGLRGRISSSRLHAIGVYYFQVGPRLFHDGKLVESSSSSIEQHGLLSEGAAEVI